VKRSGYLSFTFGTLALTGVTRAANTENPNASLNELLPNAAVWLAQILRGCAQYNVFHQMVVLSLILALGFLVWEVMQSANSGTAARATQTYVRAGVVLLTLTALYSTPNALSSWVKNLFVDSWVKVYQTVDKAAMQGLERDLSQKVEDFAGELSNYLYQTWAIDATLQGQSSSLEFGPPDPNNPSTTNTPAAPSTPSSSNSASRAQWAYWVTQGLFFLMLGVLTVYAGMVTLSGVLALLCWLCFPLALCWVILRKSEYVLLIFRLWVYSLAGAVLVPVFFAVTTPLVMVSPMEKLRQEAKVNNVELTRVAQQYAGEYQACVEGAWLKELQCDVGVSWGQSLEFAGQKVFRIVMDLLFVGMGMLIAYGVLLSLLRFVMNVVGRFLGVDTALEGAVQMGLPLGIRGRRGLSRGGGTGQGGEASGGSSGGNAGSSSSSGSSSSQPTHITGMLSRPLSRRGTAFVGQVQREGREMRETFSSAWNSETQHRAGQVAPKTDLKGPDKPS